MKTGFFKGILEKLLQEELMPDEIVTLYKPQFSDFASKVIVGSVDPNDPELEAFLKICLDVYTYSITGDVLVPDSIYDQCMQKYKSNGSSTIVYADPIGKAWDFIDHEIPGVVGTIEKVYSYKELKNKYLIAMRGVESYTLSPKFDGVSCDIKVSHGVIISGATRYNGIKGQDITALIKRAKNAKNFMDAQHLDGHYKCELCVATEDFNELVKIKKYKNRRSATQGIIGTPSNLDLARFITIIPLAFYNPTTKVLDYVAPYQRKVPFYSPADLMTDVENLLAQIRTKEFPFRVDGVVINPDRSVLGPPNELDLMDTSIAYKVNTAEGRTRIVFGYMSVGRTGKAVPMLRVEPVEVNETIVEDVSLGSYDKFLSMDLREHEEIIVYSAGDVIPQMKLPPMRTNFENEPELKIPKICAYCGEKLTRVNTEYYCANPNCLRVITGRIINFLDKMGLEGFSDKSIETIYEATKVDSIVGFLNLTEEQIQRISGFDQTSAHDFVTKVARIRSTPVSISRFFGSLGIDKISEKKCRKIFEYITLKELMGGTKKTLKDLYWELQCARGVGEVTAGTFIQYVTTHFEEIQELLGYFKLERDIKFKGNIAFTGFRPDQSTRDQIHDLGYEINEGGVTGETVALVTASMTRESTKSKAAVRMGIPIYPATSINDLLEDLKQRTDFELLKTAH